MNFDNFIMWELSASALENLKCSKCKSHLSCAPIITTISGTHVCGRCVKEYKEIQGTRNTPYEEIAREVIFPCRYHSEGCPQKIEWNKVIPHEECCDFRVYKCPVIPLGCCDWSGPNAKLLDHFIEHHSELVLHDPYKLYPDFGRDGEEHFLMPVFGFIFLVQIKLVPSNHKLLCCVRYLGNPLFISNFEFTLEIRNCRALMKKTKMVTSRNELLMNKCNSIEVNLKTIIDFVGNDDVNLVVIVTKKGRVCFKCKRDLKFYKSESIKREFHCENCGRDNPDLAYETQAFQVINTAS